MKRKAWIIRWEYVSERYRLNPNPIYFLNPRWRIDRVLSVMQAIYLNADFHYLAERLDHFLPLARWRCAKSMEGRRVIIGSSGRILVAAKVDDLKISREPSTASEIASWTQPAGVRLDTSGPKIKREQLGQPTVMTWRKMDGSNKWVETKTLLRRQS